ncbi:MAG: hypothetical protein V4611_00975 [Patescibacteria group bacterium]
MLTIKKRYPMRKLYIYGSGALIVGFAGIMAYLVQSNTNLNEFVAVAPTQPEPTLVVPANETASQASSEEVVTNSDTTGNYTSSTATTSSMAPAASQPAAEQPATTPAETPAAEPTTPSEPAQPPVAEEEKEDPGLIDEIVDMLTPEP